MRGGNAADINYGFLSFDGDFDVCLFQFDDEVARLEIAGDGDVDVCFFEGLCPAVGEFGLFFLFALAVFGVLAGSFGGCGGRGAFFGHVGVVDHRVRSRSSGG